MRFVPCNCVTGRYWPASSRVVVSGRFSAVRRRIIMSDSWHAAS